MTLKREAKIAHLEKLLSLLKAHKVKEYRSGETHIILDTVTYTDPTKLYEKLLKEGDNMYGAYPQQ